MIVAAWGAATDRGRVRALNEDALLAEPPLFVVADGMGGHVAGNVASRMAINVFMDLMCDGPISAAAAVDAIRAANDEILGSVAARPEREGMGTTISGLAVVSAAGSEHWMVFNVGDSRVYRLLDGELTQLTIDHSEAEEMVVAGQITREQARTYRRRNVVTRSLGTDPAPTADSWVFPPVDGERFLICSDGLTTELTDQEIFTSLTSITEPQHAAEVLVERALAAGGRDNVTVIVVDGGPLVEEAAVNEDTTPRDVRDI